MVWWVSLLTWYTAWRWSQLSSNYHYPLLTTTGIMAIVCIHLPLNFITFKPFHIFYKAYVLLDDPGSIAIKVVRDSHATSSSPQIWNDVTFSEDCPWYKTPLTVTAETTAGDIFENDGLNGTNQWGGQWLKACRCIIIDRHLQPQLVMNECLMMMPLLYSRNQCVYISLCVYIL